jgi:hypothetical protein
MLWLNNMKMQVPKVQIRMTRFWQRLVVVTVLASLSGMLVFHFLVLVIYNAPPNPVKIKHLRFIELYLNPFFTQDWHLFSPTPINYDVILLIKSRMRDKLTGELVESDWIDITTPIIEQLHKNRFSPLGTLIHIHVKSVFQRMLSPHYGEIVRRLCEEEPENPICKGKSPDFKARNSFADQVTVRIASAHALKLYGIGYEIHEVKFRIILNKFPRFSKRHEINQEGEVSYTDSDWIPYQPVATFR